jgi:predicted nucleic acid-binding protein
MSPLVLDCSVTMAWCFEDECDALADAVLGVFGETEVWVPALWPIEVANVLLVAERRGRLTSAGSARFLELLGGLPIIVDGGTHERALGAVLSMGRELGLSAYDATYVDLAVRLGASLATRDRSLKRACEEHGVEVFHEQ